jgi:hypothetical protein
MYSFSRPCCNVFFRINIRAFRPLPFYADTPRSGLDSNTDAAFARYSGTR